MSDLGEENVMVLPSAEEFNPPRQDGDDLDAESLAEALIDIGRGVTEDFAMKYFRGATEVKQIGLLPERIQLALEDFYADRGDIDVLVALHEEVLIEFGSLHDSVTLLAGQARRQHR